VLREFFCEARDGGGEGPPGVPDDAEERIGRLVDSLIGEFIKDPRPFRVEMVRHAARSYLTHFIEREREYRERTGLVPTYFELAFGPQPEYANHGTDVASSLEPLVVNGPDGEVRLAGKIDRVDLTPDGRAAVVTDYKLSHVSPLKDMQAGTSLQMPVYLLAMERVFGKLAVAGVYQPLKKGDPYWLFRPCLVPELQPGKGDGLPAARYDELVAAVEATIAAAARGIRHAESHPTPSDQTCRFCAFTDACRHEDWRDDA
jgi:hypothetical protein